MVLASVMVSVRVMVLARVMVFARVIVIACVMLNLRGWREGRSQEAQRVSSSKSGPEGP